MKRESTGSRGSTVIDYVIGDEVKRKKVQRVEIEEKDSDHHLIEVTIEGGNLDERKREGVVEGIWDEEEKEIFRQKLGEVELGRRGVQEEWEKLEGRIKLTVKGTEREKEGRGEERNGWWDKECKR